MDLQIWAEISTAISDVQQRVKRNPHDTYPTTLITRIHLWSVLHDRPTDWACKKANWPRATCPEFLPDQSTLSRRMRRADFEQSLLLVGQRLNGKAKNWLVKSVDGKPLELSHNSRDPDARWGRGVSRVAKGYKLHVIHSGNPMPDAMVITPLNTCEKQMAVRMVKRIRGYGYVLGDPHYDASYVHDKCAQHHHQLVCPRVHQGAGLGHHHQSPHRQRAIEMLESPAKVNNFGLYLYNQRTDIERRFSNLVCFGGGLTTLPPWVRRIWRVRRWVYGKLVVRAARTRCIRKRSDA
jgi:hypothetical protein